MYMCPQVKEMSKTMATEDVVPPPPYSAVGPECGEQSMASPPYNPGLYHIDTFIPFSYLCCSPRAVYNVCNWKVNLMHIVLADFKIQLHILLASPQAVHTGLLSAKSDTKFSTQ